jgi:hypothetical protein
MGWFDQLCRNLGLMIHHARHPDAPSTGSQVLRHEVHEKKIDETTTLRRTVIEEIEVKRRPEDPH